MQKLILLLLHERVIIINYAVTLMLSQANIHVCHISFSLDENPELKIAASTRYIYILCRLRTMFG